MQAPVKPQIQEYCTCGVKVALGDPEKIERDGRRYHGSCYRKAQPERKEVSHHRQEFPPKNRIDYETLFPSSASTESIAIRR